MREFSRFVPGLDEIQIRGITYGEYEAICEKVDSFEESQKALNFTNLVFQNIFVDVELGKQITSLPEESAEALVIIAAEKLGYAWQLDLDSFRDLPISERLYAMHLASLREDQERIEAMRRRDAEFKAKLPEIYTALKEADFWIPLSAPLRLTIYLEHLVDEGIATPENVMDLIIEWFSRDDFESLKYMVESWYSIQYFFNRKDIIKDALEAHITGRYTLSIPALLPLVEGYSRSQLGVPRHPGVGRWLSQELERTLNHESGIAKIDAGVSAHYIEKTLFLDVPKDNRTPELYEKWVQDKGFRKLHRNAILHGLQADYATEENSLRTFFLIASLASQELG